MRASASIPRPDGRPTWFITMSAASQTESRTGRSQGVPRRKIGAGEARDWLHLSGRSAPGSTSALPLEASAPSPDVLSEPSFVSLPRPGAATGVRLTWIQDRHLRNARKCLISFGLRYLVVDFLWRLKSFVRRSLAALDPQFVGMCIHNSPRRLSRPEEPAGRRAVAPRYPRWQKRRSRRDRIRRVP